jgi:hypothetical protein
MARPKQIDKRTKRITAPATEKELSDYNKACAKVRLEPADNLRKLAEAFVAHVERYGHMTYPITFAPPEKKR